MRATAQEIAEELKAAGSVAVFLHVRPDGDTVGSGLALTAALRKAGKAVDVFCSDPVNLKFAYLAGFNEINCKSNERYDVYAAVDCSDERRMGDYAGEFLAAKRSVSVDHHRTNTEFAKRNYVDSASASTAEMMFKVIEALGVPMDAAIAECLYTGVSTDTGNFCHSNVTQNTFYTAYRLMKYGVDVHAVTGRLYRNSPRERIALLARALSGLRFFEDGKVSVMTVLLKDLEATNADASNTEGFIDFGIGIAGVEVALCILQHAPNVYKVSFRSAGKADVCSAASVFGGGGHTLASGCQLTGDYYDVLDKLLKAVRDEL